MRPWIAIESPFCALAESPRYAHGQWTWVDIDSRRLFVSKQASLLENTNMGFEAQDLPDEIGSAIPTGEAGVYWGLGRAGLWHLAPCAMQLIQTAPFDSLTHRYNDGRADALGRIWISTLVDARAPATAALYCIDAHETKVHVDKLIVGNGLAFSPCNRYLFLSDSRHKCIWRCDFDLENGLLSHREQVRAYTNGTERPDGAAMTEDGSYWVAILEGYRLDRYSLDGKLLEEIELPLAKPTMPCFGGTNRSELLVTSAQATPATPNRPGFERVSLVACQTEYVGVEENFARLNFTQSNLQA